MASSVLRNPQQIKQPTPPKASDMATGSAKVSNSSLGTGSGKVINSVTDKSKKK
jgi:hypothetical protein